MNCEVFREMLGPYVDETLEEDRRQWFRRHLRECPGCRQAAIAEDPSLFFTMVPVTPAPPEAVETCVAAVTARIRQDRFERRLSRRHRPWMAAAAAAVIVVGGGLAWRVMTGGDGTLQPAVGTARDSGRNVVSPTVEVETRGEDVRVYRFATDGDADTAVYFIVDPALEL